MKLNYLPINNHKKLRSRSSGTLNTNTPKNKE